MENVRYPDGLPRHGFSMQAAAIASALVERENAHIYRRGVREWLDRIDSPTGGVMDDVEQGREFAEFITLLIRIGAGLLVVE